MTMPRSSRYELIENGDYFYIRRLSDGFKSQRLLRKDEHLQRYADAVAAGTFDLECECEPRSERRRKK